VRNRRHTAARKEAPSDMDSFAKQIPPNARIGLGAGWGRYPVVVAKALKRQGRPVYCLGIKDHTDPVLREICDDFCEVGLAKLGAAIRYFRRNDIRYATMAGKIHKVAIFQRFAWLKHLPDWRFCRTFFPHWVSRTQDRTDDNLMHSVINAFARDGITFGPATDFAPELLVKFGQLTGKPLSKAQQLDVRFGWRLAKELGRLDVGQSVAVKGQAAIALEAIEGTDACIRRAGELCPAGGFTIVKVAKPQQDMRFDVPTFGMGTLETLVASGGRVLAIEADKTIVIDEEEVVAYANRHGIQIVAIDDAQAASAADAA
jgi:DUF1009 family protein